METESRRASSDSEEWGEWTREYACGCRERLAPGEGTSEAMAQEMREELDRRSPARGESNGS